ncbi:MAG TPA: TetR/AcrR family transcriptional regulator [Iamia sp.]|nr:TetR/AcrR family transcriptional regulator [Iamia sp.]
MAATTLGPHLRPRKQPRQRRAHETRARILDAARRVFEEHGYAHGTTNRIAAAAGLSVGSLYQYFPNKDAILVELVDAHIDAGTTAVLAALPADPEGWSALPLAEVIGPVVAAMVALHADGRGLHRVLFEEAPRPPEQLARLRALERDLAALLAGTLAAHPEVTAPDPGLAARLTIDAIESLVHRIATDATSGIADDVLAAEITRLVVAYLTA